MLPPLRSSPDQDQDGPVAVHKDDLEVEESESVLDTVEHDKGALRRAEDLSLAAARVGFDWPDHYGIMLKLQEEIAEVQEELDVGSGDYGLRDWEQRKRIAAEVGDVLFSAVNLARTLAIDSEAALAMTNEKFERRFKYVEQRLREEGQHPTDTSVEHMRELWQEAKRFED